MAVGGATGSNDSGSGPSESGLERPAPDHGFGAGDDARADRALSPDHHPIDVLGVQVAALDRESAADAVEALIRRPDPALMAFVNAHTLNIAATDPKYRQILQEADLVLRDGIGLGLAARLKGKRFPANLNGSDFTPIMLERIATQGWTVFLLGGAHGVAEEAARRLGEEIDGLEIVGTADGMFRISDEQEVVRQIRHSGADVLIVALGNPLQEQFLARYLPTLGVRLGVGVGAFLDFSVGTVRRAPPVANRWGVEWVFRLAQEPRRLWRRYLVGNPLFLARCLRASSLDRRRAHQGCGSECGS